MMRVQSRCNASINGFLRKLMRKLSDTGKVLYRAYHLIICLFLVNICRAALMHNSSTFTVYLQNLCKLNHCSALYNSPTRNNKRLTLSRIVIDNITPSSVHVIRIVHEPLNSKLILISFSVLKRLQLNLHGLA